MVAAWKLPHLAKGLLTFVPGLYEWHRVSHRPRGGSESPRYCYSVYLRHLVTLQKHGFTSHGAEVGELGPGNSLGAGLAAMLCGAKRYVGLDKVPYSAQADLPGILQVLAEMFSRRERIPDQTEFPAVRPTLDCYDFPSFLGKDLDIRGTCRNIQSELARGLGPGRTVQYHAPWTGSGAVVNEASLDLIFSQAVLEHVDGLKEIYQASWRWLKPGGYASHVIDFAAHHMAPLWNGHWAYSDWQWRLVRGKRVFLLNRAMIGTHLKLARAAGFNVLAVLREHDAGGYRRNSLADGFRECDPSDLQTRSVMLILEKPRHGTDALSQNSWN